MSHFLCRELAPPTFGYVALLTGCVQSASAQSTLVAPRRVTLLCLPCSLEAVVAAVSVTAIAIGTDRYQAMTPPTVELPPCLRPMSTHPRPENRIRFLDIGIRICETPPWRCRGNHAIADEGTGIKTAPSTNFGGPYANHSQGRGPKKWLSLPPLPVSKPGCHPRLSPTSRGSTQPATPIALGRKNYLFVGDKDCGTNLANIYSLTATCELNGIDPQRYFEDVLIRIQHHPASRIDELLPDRWHPPESGPPTDPRSP